MSETENELHKWIPVKESLPMENGYKCYVTMKRTDSSYRFTEEMVWFRGKWFWANGKLLADCWEIIAWQKRWYPEPYNGN